MLGYYVTRRGEASLGIPPSNSLGAAEKSKEPLFVIGLFPCPFLPDQLLASFSAHIPPYTSRFAMGVQREPGQKGVNWSNIAVGKFDLSYDATRTDYLLTLKPRIGGIMNMVISLYAMQGTSAERSVQSCVSEIYSL